MVRDYKGAMPIKVFYARVKAELDLNERTASRRLQKAGYETTPDGFQGEHVIREVTTCYSPEPGNTSPHTP